MMLPYDPVPNFYFLLIIIVFVEAGIIFYLNNKRQDADRKINTIKNKLDELIKKSEEQPDFLADIEELKKRVDEQEKINNGLEKETLKEAAEEISPDNPEVVKLLIELVKDPEKLETFKKLMDED